MSPSVEQSTVGMDPPTEKGGDQPIHLEGMPKHVVHANLHDEVMAKDVTAAGLADEMLQVDDERAAEIREELARNRQGGWRPITSEERQLNSRLNWKLDLMVSLQVPVTMLPELQAPYTSERD